MVNHPVVTGVSPKEGPPGTRVTIRGEFLGTSATDLVGLKICGCDCLLSAEWKSRNKIIARSGPCKGRGDIIVTTRSGGEGTSTVQFRGYHESIGPVKESAVWVEESAPAALSWGRRPMSPASYAPPDPLGLSTEGDECKFPEEDLHEMFPDCSGKLSDENFHPGWYLLEHHNMTNFEDLRAGALFLERKVDSQKEGQLSFLKANTGSVMDQLDRLILVKNMFEEDHRQNGKEPLISLHNAIQDSIQTADVLFSDILVRKDKADKTRAALALLIRHKFLFQLPAAIDRNIKKKEYDLVVNDYTRVKNLFGWTEVKLFQKILAEIDKRIFDLRDKLYARIKTMPIAIQEQRKYIQILRSLSWEGDAAWDAITSRKDYLLSLLNKLKDYFKLKEQMDQDKVKRKTLSVPSGEAGGDAGGAWVAAASGALADEVGALWTLARWYFAGELGGAPAAPDRSDHFKEMMLNCVEVFAAHMRAALAGAGDSAALVASLQRLRDAHEALLKLDLPSQPVSIVEKVMVECRTHGMVAFLAACARRVRALADQETWRVDHYSDYGAVTKLPRQLEAYITETLSSIKACVADAGRRESALLAPGAAATATLQRHLQDMLVAYAAGLERLALDNADQDFVNTSFSVALGNQKSEQESAGGNAGSESATHGRPPWQRRLLIAAANAEYTRHVTLTNLAALFDKYKFPKPTAALQAAREALLRLESAIAATYLEHKGDPLVGTIEHSMYMGRHKLDGLHGARPAEARPYVYEIINNLIAVHAELDSVGTPSARLVRDMCETVCEELARLAACAPAPALGAPAAPAALQARLELRVLHTAVSSLLTRKAENYLKEALPPNAPVETEEERKLVEKIVGEFRRKMALQITSLNSNTEMV